MSQVMFSVDEASRLIASGQPLLLAGDEKALRQLPAGNWIGGTIPYFMADEGGLFTQSQVFVTEMPDSVVGTSISVYDESSLPHVYDDIPDNGFGVIVMPASSPVHLSFALNAPGYGNFATKPLIGWISGVAMDELARVTPKVMDGRTGTLHEGAALVMHATLAPGKVADIGIVNIFAQGNGDVISFPDDGFSASEVLVNGERRAFADYLRETGMDTRCPLVADYGGAMINVAFQNVGEDGRVDFYAPVFAGMEYRHAQPVEDYVREFTDKMPNGEQGAIALSCNCILNYLYSELEGKRTGDVVGPCTFGEVAYQLLNQTMVYLTIVDQV